MPFSAADPARRLPWLLAYRVAVGTALLVTTLAADLFSWTPHRMSPLLYGVALSTFLIVVVVGLLLRAGVAPRVLGAVHLGTVILGAALVVQATGGAESTFSFLYLLAILDAAILGSMGATQTMAA